MGEKIKASISDIKRIYRKENFEIVNIEINEDTEEETTMKKESVEEETEQQLISNSESEIEKEQLISTHNVALEREKTFSNLSKEKARNYLMVLLLFGIFLGISRIIDSLLSENVQSGCKEFVDITISFSDRNHGLLYCLFLFREDLRLGQISSSTAALLSTGFENEEKISFLRPTLTGTYQPLMDFLNMIDSIRMCTEFFVDDQNCTAVYGGGVSLGYKMIVWRMLTYMNKLYKRFMIEVNNGNVNFGLSQFSVSIVMLTDVRNKYEQNSFNGISGKLGELEDNWVGEMKMYSIVIFSFFLVLLIIILSIIWKTIANNMSIEIFQGLAILNILPTIHFRANPEFLKEMNTSSLLN